MQTESIIQRVQRVVQEVVFRTLGESRSGLRGLFLPWVQSEFVTASRAKLILSRVRLVAGLFAVFTPAWILLDAIAFPDAVWKTLAAGRLVASAGFAVVPFLYRDSDRIRDAYYSIFLLFSIPTLFFLFSYSVFVQFDLRLEAVNAGFIAGYTFLPFVLVAGISVFPLTALEGVMCMAPSLAVQMFVGGIGPGLVSRDAQLGLVWLLLLIGAVAVISAMSQLHYLTEIILKAAHDPLTGAFNRATGLELLERYLLLARRNRTPLTFLFFDLDHFKSVNDDHGHEAGDLVLSRACGLLADATRNVDLLIRWGGEEFLLILPQSDESNAQTVVRRIRRTGLGLRPEGAPVTASVGMAEYPTDGIDELPGLIELADQRMYLAKQGGRNRICRGSGEMIRLIG